MKNRGVVRQTALSNLEMYRNGLEEIAGMMPDSSPEQGDYREGAALARQIYQAEALRILDPSKVEELCKAEPWTTAQRMEEVSHGKFGFVTEKLEKAHDLFARDSKHYIAFNEAFEQAKKIYFDSMKYLSRQFATGKTRVQVEEMNFSLASRSRHFENNGTYIRSRLLKLCELNGLNCQKFGKPSPPDPTRQQFVARFRL